MKTYHEAVNNDTSHFIFPSVFPLSVFLLTHHSQVDLSNTHTHTHTNCTFNHKWYRKWFQKIDAQDENLVLNAYLHKANRDPTVVVGVVLKPPTVTNRNEVYVKTEAM